MSEIEKLAIEGGNPVHAGNPIVETDIIEDEEIEAVVKVLKSKKTRRAEVALEYEKALADYYGVKHAIAVANGTVSLHIALAAMGIGPGDEVIVTPITFVASDTCVLEQNAIPIFADIDPDTLTIDPKDVERKITDRTKAIIPVSISGMPMDMDPLMDLAKKHNLFVLEDNAQAPGAKYKGRKLGTIGHVSSYSTVTGKIISTGEGGYLLTNDDDLYNRMWGFHDFARNIALGKASKFNFSMPCTNYRITNLQAALGLVQLSRLDAFNQKRKQNAHLMDEGLKDCPGIRLFKEPSWSERVYFYYLIRIVPEELGADLVDFAKALAAEGVYNFGYITTTRMMTAQHLLPLFLEKNGYGNTHCPFDCPKYGKEISYYRGQLPVAEKAEREVFWLSPVHPLMSQTDLDDTIKAVRKVATAFVERKKMGLSNTFATDEERSLCWDPYYIKKG
jgi:perosamine synthetase